MSRAGVAMLFLPAIAWAQETQSYRFEANPGTVGDKTTIKIEAWFDVDITVKDSEDKPRTFQISQLKTERFAQEVTAMQDGAGRIFSVKCPSSEVQTGGTNRPLKTEPTTLNGKTFRMRRTPKARGVEMADGSILPPEAAGVGEWEDFDKLLPDKEVKAGDSWTVDPKAVAFLAIGNMRETKSASLTGTLKGVEDGKATFTFAGALEGETQDDATVKVTLAAGEMVFDTSRGRPVSIRVAGAIESVKDVLAEYVKPGGLRGEPQKVGEIRTTSRKLEVKIAFE